MKSIFPALAACFLLMASACGATAHQKAYPFEMPQVATPSIPARSVNVTDFGAIGDGVTLNSAAFSKAMKQLSGKGGGRLIVPAGIWLTGPITLESCTELHLEKNAILVFSTDQSLYPIIDTNFEGLDVRRCLSPINALGAHDIAITGEGIIDGNGDAWREVKRRKVSDDQWKEITARGGMVSPDGKGWYPDEGYYKARLTAGSLNYPDPSLDEQEIKTFLRPVMVSLRECERVLLEGCTFQNSPCWNIHPLYCRNLTIKNITVRNPHYSANGDGIDIDACENVILRGSSFDVGDDAICIKSGKDADGRRHARKCRNLIIEDCTVYHGHGGFVVGSEMSGGVENILVRGCRFMGTDVGLRFKSTRGRGGLVKDIWCEDIYMKDIVSYGVIFNLYYAGVAATDLNKDGATSEPEVTVDETTPEFRGFHFSNLVCSGAKQAIYINGLPELPLRDIEFSNSCFRSRKGHEVHNAENVTFENVTINGNKL
ncbi:MAG: glycoside hydrolase family 28 protein [Bacteroidales bacterium]|nr:glycoside hydrolase family 28 protein [Bacteroidales bacterium]